MSGQILYQDWSDFLIRLEAICEPSELHGMLCGSLCGAVDETAAQWAEKAYEFMDLIEPQGNTELAAAMQAFHELGATSLQEGSYALQLMLPDDAVPLTDRTEALAKWCQGFLHGLASAGEGIAKQLDEAGQESLHDLAHIAQASKEVTEGEENEGFYADLVEYVRLAVFSLHAQFHQPNKLHPTTH